MTRMIPESKLALGAKVGLTAFLALLLLFHFGVSAAYVSPPSPARIRLQPIFESYVEPYFSQHWELFAPEPLMDTRVVMVSCRLREPEGATRDTPFTDISTPLRDLKNRYRLSPADRLDRAAIAASHLLYDQPEPLAKKLLDLPDGNLTGPLAEARERYAKDLAVRRARGSRLMTRIASAECDRLYGAGHASQVQVRLAIVKPPPFSERNQPARTPDAAYTEFDWADHEPVAPL